jgi:hypothetical protein
MNMRCVRCAIVAAALICGTAFAHKPSDSYLTLAVADGKVDGQWDIALRDLDVALGLDTDQDGAITWGEVRAKHAQIASYALARLTVGSAGAPCAPVMREQLIDQHSDGAYAVLHFGLDCAAAPASLDVDYRLFFDIDPQHRGLVKVAAQGDARAGIFSADAPSQRFDLADAAPLAQFAEYLREGVWHIWTGFDHILFLLSLLLPAVLVRGPAPGGAWTGVPRFRAAFLDVFKVVTAFTIAHSITLTLAALGMVSLPSRFVESAIAASVVLAALNNVRPVVYGGRWIFAFLFGLIHGFGFASVLTDLGLPQGSLLLALVAFNLGVELGQLAIVAVFLPVAYAIRDTALYRRAVFVGGSLLVAAIAAAWLVERAFDLALIPGAGS